MEPHHAHNVFIADRRVGGVVRVAFGDELFFAVALFHYPVGHHRVGGLECDHVAHLDLLIGRRFHQHHAVDGDRRLHAARHHRQHLHPQQMRQQSQRNGQNEQNNDAGAAPG